MLVRKPYTWNTHTTKEGETYLMWFVKTCFKEMAFMYH